LLHKFLGADINLVEGRQSAIDELLWPAEQIVWRAL
jgi:hypothetical protein